MEYIQRNRNNNVFVQIGTNDGDDMFREIVIKFKPSTVILIEPNYQLYNTIKQNYSEIEKHSTVIILSKCIYERDDEEVSLFIPAKDGIYGQPGVQPERALGNYTYNNKHFSLVPMNDWGQKKDMVEIKSKTITFNSLFKIFDIKHINYLQIDTEGYDSQIISSIDFDKITIDIIRYEKWPFDENCFSKYHNENKHIYGINGMKNVEKLLISYNYKLYDIQDADGDDIIAIKNQ